MMGCRRRNRKRNQASTSEAGGDRHLKKSKKASTSKTTEGGEILRRKKEMLEAYNAAEATELLGMNLTMAQAEQAGARETKTKRRKVIKVRLPQELIDYMIATPHPSISEHLTDHQLAKHTKHFRESYAKIKVIDEKIRAYYQAIIDQYNAKGYAEDEGEEIIDDEGEETVDD